MRLNQKEAERLLGEWLTSAWEKSLGKDFPKTVIKAEIKKDD